jgi:hypothetical protein
MLRQRYKTHVQSNSLLDHGFKLVLCMPRAKLPRVRMHCECHFVQQLAGSGCSFKLSMTYRLPHGDEGYFKLLGNNHISHHGCNPSLNGRRVDDKSKFLEEIMMSHNLLQLSRWRTVRLLSPMAKLHSQDCPVMT